MKHGEIRCHGLFLGPLILILTRKRNSIQLFYAWVRKEVQ